MTNGDNRVPNLVYTPLSETRKGSEFGLTPPENVRGFQVSFKSPSLKSEKVSGLV